MDSTSPRIQQIQPSLTLSATNQAKAMRARGEEVYGLAGGEPDQDTPDCIKEAAIRALNEGKTKYTPAAGIPELREAIAHKLTTENTINYDPRQIIVTSGAKQACFSAILAVCQEGDEVIIPSPYWVSYPEMVRMVGAQPVFVETSFENNWKITPEQFEEHMTGRTKMIILNTPGNPTGSVYSKEELKALAEVALYEDIVILSDEIYEHLVYGDTTHTSIASLGQDIYDLTITVNGFSKSYSMTGWRIGYAAAPKPIADAMSRIQGHMVSNATTFAQYGALAALQEAGDFLSDLRLEYDMRRQFVYQRLAAIPNVSLTEPQGAFYCFLNMEQLGLKSINLCDKLLSRYRVATIPGIAFGNDSSIRISYCTSLDILNEGLTRIEEFCKAH